MMVGSVTVDFPQVLQQPALGASVGDARLTPIMSR
jgi:hypothetical protein